MTISEKQRDTYQSTVSEFNTQKQENTCLPVALVNILDDLATRHDVPEIRIEEDEILDMVDYDPLLGSTTDFLPEQLNPKIKPFNYVVREDRALSMDELDELIRDDGSSYPLVELDTRYFDWVDGYDVQTGMYGEAQPHIIVPFAFNDETVLIFDPFEDFYLPPESNDTPPKEIPQPLFYEWWSGESAPRWTLWIDQQEQQTFDQA